MKWILPAALLLFTPAIAHADPCEGRLPARVGETFAGVVRYIGDGDSLCVGPSTNPATWIEVRLADFDAPELQSPTGRADRDRLGRIVQGRVLTCVAVRGRNGRVIVYDRVIGACRLNGVQVGDLLREAGGREGGN
ncbi:thermonuclease family protein [Brevundimonas mediterranea]|jgi:endonuclease YncB( thermonuclease family)|uniref:thermonuclease family protein n=1 Tax=Brevundimonas mediterranea TaxID=74329 RepID=UPI001224184A|nr:MAG: nuclease [Brevundimonas sp.]